MRLRSLYKNAKVSRLQLKNILLAGGDNTGALAGTAQNTTISEVWAEGLNINLMDRLLLERQI